MKSKFSLSTYYRREYLYTFDKDTLSTFSVSFKALSKRDIDFIRDLDNPSENDIRILVLEKSLIKFIDVISPNGVPIETPNINILTLPQQKTLHTIISDISYLTPTIVEQLTLNAKIIMEPKFQTETWNCDECQRRGLDKKRNCKKRDDYEDIYDFTFKVTVGTEEFKDCPMFNRDTTLIKDMLSCYSAFEKGILPDVGGLVDQTEFYQYAVDILTAEIQRVKQETTK